MEIKTTHIIDKELASKLWGMVAVGIEIKSDGQYMLEITWEDRGSSLGLIPDDSKGKSIEKKDFPLTFPIY